MIFLKDVAEKCNPTKPLSFFFGYNLLTIFASGTDHEAPTTGKPKQTKFLSYFQEF